MDNRRTQEDASCSGAAYFKDAHRAGWYGVKMARGRRKTPGIKPGSVEHAIIASIDGEYRYPKPGFELFLLSPKV